MSRPGLKADITPTQIVQEFNAECVPYETYRKEFKDVYKQLMSNVGFDESEWSWKPPKSFRFAFLHESIQEFSNLSGKSQFVTDIRPIFEATIAIEKECYKTMKKQLQILYDFYNNSYEKSKAELAFLAPRLEEFQKNRPTEPEKCQEMDKITARFTELQRLLEQMVKPGVEFIQESHLKVLREVTEMFGKQNEQLAAALAPCEKLPAYKKVPRKESGKQPKKGEGD